MASSSDAPLRLVIVEGDSPIPRYPFVDNWFPVRLYIEKGGQMTRIAAVGDEDVNVSVSLMYEGSQTGPSFDDAISLEDERGGPAVLNPNGITSLRMKIKTLSLHHENKAFIANIHVASKYNVQSVSTPPMTIVSYRLLLSFTNLPDDGDHRCWYKDEGGTSNKIDLSVVLQGPAVPPTPAHTTTTRATATAAFAEKDDAVKGRRIPLKVSLLYASGQPVLSKDMLSVSTATNPVAIADVVTTSADGAAHIEISEMTGRVTLRLRINDVSKNHQRQAFKMLVAPDIARYVITHHSSVITHRVITYQSLVLTHSSPTPHPPLTTPLPHYHPPLTTRPHRPQRPPSRRRELRHQSVPRGQVQTEQDS